MQNNDEKEVKLFEVMSDKELLAFHKEIVNSNGTFSEDSKVRKVCEQLYSPGLIVLHIQSLVWPLMSVMAKRMEKYSDVIKTLTTQTN